jgi:hypothetical protein
MVSNVSRYPFDPADQYVAYGLGGDERPHGSAPSAAGRQLPGQIRFDAPCVSIPDTLNHLTHISMEVLEIELERAARRQEQGQ